MNPDIEKVLLAQAAREAEQGPRLSDSIAMGAGVGALLGTMGGMIPHGAGIAINSGKDALAAARGLTPAPKGIGGRLKPGFRMAGGLMGLVAGGALGAGYANQMRNEPTGTGALLAKIQAQGGMMPGDEHRLEQALADAYSQQGLLG